MYKAARVYAEQLQRFNCGHALWWPEHRKGPDGQERAVEIGDVGYVDNDGAFHPLFNATYPLNDPRNAGRIPAKHITPLECNVDSLDIKKGFLPVGPLHSSSVISRRIGAEIAADDHATQAIGVTLSYSFECKSDAGAVLMLWDDSTKTTVEEGSRVFEEYMVRHHGSWYEYARNKRGLSIKYEDIILVRGFIKTSRWTIAAFLGSTSRSHEVTINGRLGPFASVDVGYSSCEESCSSISPRSGPPHRMKAEEIPVSWSSNPRSSAICEPYHDRSPDGSESIQDQCIFLNYYKMKRRRLLPDQLTASAGEYGAQPRGGDSDSTFATPVAAADASDSEVETESFATDFYTPLDKILDYILEFSDAEIAIASHNDLKSFSEPLGDSRPATFVNILRSSLPKIIVDENLVGKLSGCSELQPPADSHHVFKPSLHHERGNTSLVNEQGIREKRRSSSSFADEPSPTPSETSILGLSSQAQASLALVTRVNDIGGRSIHRAGQFKARERSTSSVRSEETLISTTSSDSQETLNPTARFHTFVNIDLAYAANCRQGLVIPQKVYQARAGYEPLPTIRFSCGGIPGVRLVDAEPGTIRNLDNRTFRPLINPNSNRITLRILWPGYVEWFCANISVKHTSTGSGPGVTMEELAGTVASRIQEFYANMRYNACTAPGWDLQRIPFENLYVLELHHVGQSSWQPVLMYNQ